MPTQQSRISDISFILQLASVPDMRGTEVADVYICFRFPVTKQIW